MTDRDENTARTRATTPPKTGGGLADEVERARTPRTPLRALAGVWLTVALVVLVLGVVGLTLYFVASGD